MSAINCPHCGGALAEQPKKPYGQRSPEMAEVALMPVGGFKDVPDDDAAQRIAVYLRRLFGPGAAKKRKNPSGGYKVWRAK